MRKINLESLITTPGKALIARFSLVEDGHSPKWHRAVFLRYCDVDAQMAAVNAHLESMGWPPVSDYQSLKDHAAIAAQDA